MSKLSIPRFGFAVAAACTIAYVGCVFVMMTVPQGTAIKFFNSLMHGVDVTTIMRWDMPLSETVLGTIGTFVLGWLFGALIAGCYNCCAKTVRSNELDA
ncbi:MAG TPA: DUF5676 family membrane protein, partial [Pirellulaceae bacterium]|nr:hypothetical protein [Planctomycetales bacterium]MCC7336034.1 hypothetical protein [Pirellulaceae bacterium]HRX78796.1 DUF5676 family membrane protein [Pirellulaceae bacterium]